MDPAAAAFNRRTSSRTPWKTALRLPSLIGGKTSNPCARSEAPTMATSLYGFLSAPTDGSYARLPMSSAILTGTGGVVCRELSTIPETSPLSDAGFFTFFFSGFATGTGARPLVTQLSNGPPRVPQPYPEGPLRSDQTAIHCCSEPK